MSVFVVDASVAAKWFLLEEHSEAARRFRDPPYRLCAPDFFLLEMDNVFCKRVRRDELDAADAEVARRILRELPIQYRGFGALLDRAYEMAVETRTSPYDCLYAALAQVVGGRMVTADRRFFERLSRSPFADHVMWVEDVGRERTPAKRLNAKRPRRKRE